MTRLLAFVFVLLAFAGPGRAQSLGELAEQEKAKKKDPKAKTYTEDDLKKYKPPPKPQASPTPAPGALPPSRVVRPKPTIAPPSQGEGAKEAGSEGVQSEPEPGDPTSAPGTPRNEAEWRARAKNLRIALAEAEKKVAGLEDQLRIATLDMQPNPEDIMDPNRLQKLEARKAQLRVDIEKAKADVEKARQDLAKLEAEALAKGVPGWVRE